MKKLEKGLQTFFFLEKLYVMAQIMAQIRRNPYFFN